MPPRYHFPHPFNSLVHLVHHTVVSDERIISHPVGRAPLPQHFIEHLVGAVHTVRFTQAIDQAVVGHDVRLEPLLPHPPEQPPRLVDPPPRRLPAPCAHPDPAVPGNEHRVRVGVRLAARTGSLHLVEQEPGIPKPPVLAQRGDQGVVALRVRGAAELAHAVERGERVAREPFLPERADDVGERGGGDERGVRAEEAEERRERVGAGERERRGAERGLGDLDGAGVGVGVVVRPGEEGEGEGGGEAAAGRGRGGGERPLRAQAARGAREDEARDGMKQGCDGVRGEAGEGRGDAERGVEAAVLEEGDQELRHEAGWGRGRGRRWGRRWRRRGRARGGGGHGKLLVGLGLNSLGFEREGYCECRLRTALIACSSFLFLIITFQIIIRPSEPVFIIISIIIWP